MSTTSSASFICASALGFSKGDRGSAMRPVRADSKIPNGAISFRNESILEGFAELAKVSKEQDALIKLAELTSPQCNCLC